MMRASPFSAITLLLVALCGGLGWLVYEEARRPLAPVLDRDTPRPPSAERTDASVSAPQFRMEPIETFGEIVARPLFNISRRPIAVAAESDDARPAELNIMLSGVVIGRDHRIVHLESTADKRVHALGLGDSIANWRVESIEPDRVVLRAGSRVETIFLRKAVPLRRTTPPSGTTASRKQTIQRRVNEED